MTVERRDDDAERDGDGEGGDKDGGGTAGERTEGVEQPPEGAAPRSLGRRALCVPQARLRFTSSMTSQMMNSATAT